MANNQMFDDPVQRCGTVTTMVEPATVFTLTVSISDDEALKVDLDVGEDVHVDDIIELLVETIKYLEQS